MTAMCGAGAVPVGSAARARNATPAGSAYARRIRSTLQVLQPEKTQEAVTR